MEKDALAGFDLGLGPVVSLLLFAGFMLGVLAWIARPKARQTYQAISQSPFDDDLEAPHGR